MAELLGGIDEEIPKSPRGKGIRVVLVVDIPNWTMYVSVQNQTIFHLISGGRTPIKRFSTKQMPPPKKRPRKEKEPELDLEEEFTSTPPPLDIDTGNCLFLKRFFCRLKWDYLLSGSVCFAVVFNAQEDSLKLKLLASGISPKVVQVVGNLRRSARQKEKEREQAAEVAGSLVRAVYLLRFRMQLQKTELVHLV